MMFNLAKMRLWLMITLLYISQGLPLGLAMDALPSILKNQGASLQSLVFLPLVGLPWILKFLWAPIVDNYKLSHFGRRRSWLVPMQTLVVITLILVWWLGIEQQHAPYILLFMFIASMASATQDIATDGLAAELFTGKDLVRANMIQVGGTMVGFFLGGAGVMILSGYLGLQYGVLLPLVIVLSSLMLLWCWQEPAENVVNNNQMLQEQRTASIKHFIKRQGSIALLAMAFLSSLAMVSGFGLGKLVLIDQAWSIQSVGQLGMYGGVVTILLGCGGGAWLIQHFGTGKIFILGLAMTICSATIWIMLTQMSQISFTHALMATIFGCFGSGAASVALMTRAMRFAQQGTQAGTDMTAIQSARDLGEMSMSSSLIAIAAIVGYSSSFALGIIAAVVVICLLLRNLKIAQA
ncbi:MFS transporter [Acinetobacter rudis]|uniref:MFS transporter n=1 Tax=Acinetobacter rudis TaxID=632955 RepID=A0AAW8JAT0_9GAMM|nr:MFS transporter [Acinetobacter rudis]MDQ8936688.1 MFS transporter [Acinetobacter rudis]MDQ9018896.1 MFS transporter [Acinetobacter rudis]